MKTTGTTVVQALATLILVEENLVEAEAREAAEEAWTAVLREATAMMEGEDAVQAALDNATSVNKKAT